MKIFKRILTFLVVLAGLCMVASCRDKKTDNVPVISGAEDKVIEKGKKFVPLDGITAYDEEDGDLTASIQYTGNVNVNKEGEYTLIYKAIDSSGNESMLSYEFTVFPKATDDNANGFIGGCSGFNGCSGSIIGGTLEIGVLLLVTTGVLFIGKRSKTKNE